MPLDGATDWSKVTIDDLLLMIPPILQLKFEAMDEVWKREVIRSVKRYMTACVNMEVRPEFEAFIEIIQNTRDQSVEEDPHCRWRNYGVKSFLVAYFRNRGEGIPSTLRGRHAEIRHDLQEAGFTLTNVELSRYCWRLKKELQREMEKFVKSYDVRSPQIVLDFYKLASDPGFIKFFRLIKPFMERSGFKFKERSK